MKRKNRIDIPVAAALALSLLLAFSAFGAGGKFRETKHGRLGRGVDVRGEVPPGSCRQCHGMHVGRGGASPISSVSPDILKKNELCAQCHEVPAGSSWLGMNEYSFSGHGNSSETYPRHGGREVRLCLQCHDPHGRSEEGVDLIPAMLREVEEKGCMGGGGQYGGCHSAGRADRPDLAKDLESEHRKQHSHRVSRRTLWHRPDEVEEAVPGETAASMRHVECVDCHNPHMARPGLHQEGTNEVSPILFGAYGVRPIVWPQPGGQVINFEVVRFDPRRARSDNVECYLCFRCHSYFAYGNAPPPDESDMADLFNPNNASYHPVAAEGKNPTIPSLLPPWTGGSQMYCSDCHSSDDVRSDRVPFGPHGSRHDDLLRRPYARGGAPQPREDLCFLCHNLEAYVENGILDSCAASGFCANGTNLHLLPGHTDFGCASCHTTHGSPELPHLLTVRDQQNRQSRILTITLPSAGGYTVQSCGTLSEGGNPCHGQT